MKDKYYTYKLTGESIRTLRAKGLKFWSAWHQGHNIEDVKSHKGWVSVPKELFIPDSNNKTFDEQKKMIKEYNPKAFMGNVADYCELAYLHLEATGKYLFSIEYNYNWARTTTKTVGANVARVGDFNTDFGLHVYHLDRGLGNSYVFASPLVAGLGTRKLGTYGSLDLGKVRGRPKGSVKKIKLDGACTITIEITIK